VQPHEAPAGEGRAVVAAELLVVQQRPVGEVLVHLQRARRVALLDVGLHVRGVPAQLDGDEVVRDLLAREGLARRRAEHRVVLLDQVALRLVARRAVRRRANELQHLAALEDERRVELLGRWRRAVRTRDEDVDAAALVEEVQGDGRLPRRLLLDAVEDVVEVDFGPAGE